MIERPEDFNEKCAAARDIAVAEQMASADAYAFKARLQKAVEAAFDAGVEAGRCLELQGVFAKAYERGYAEGYQVGIEHAGRILKVAK